MDSVQLLNATVCGDGPHTVVFGNGFATTQRAWDAVVERVPDSWRIVRFDYVGTTPATAGRWIADRYRTYEGHADDLTRLLMQLDVRDAVFVGHSMSGMISAIASLRAGDRLAHLVMVGASACYTDHGSYHGGFTQGEIDDLLRQVDADLSAWMAGFSGTLLGHDATAHQLHEYMETLLAMRPDIGRTLLHSIFRSDYRDMLPALTVPTTLLQTADDVAVPRSAAEHLAQHTPCTAMHVLPVSGHLPHVTHPTLVAPLVLSVLERHRARRAGAE